jgi:hypothetical protein
MLIIVIISCEILFWVFILLGLVFRYLLHRKLIGKIFLYCTPLIDLTLLITTAISIKNGDEISLAHGLAAMYIGVSIAFGKQMIGWADKHFAYRFAHGEKPQKQYGNEHAQNERQRWLHHLLAWFIGSVILLGIHLYVNDADRSGIFLGIITKWVLILIIDFLISFSYAIWPRKQK